MRDGDQLTESIDACCCVMSWPLLAMKAGRRNT